MAVTVTSNIEIYRPPEDVFALFADIPSNAEHISAVERIEMLTDGPVGVGTRFRETRIMFKREATEEMEITAFDPPRGMTLSAESCGARYTSNFRFEPTDAGTRVTIEFTAEPQTFMAKMMSPMMKMMAGKLRACFETDMAELKAVAESSGREAADPPAGAAATT